MSITTRRYRICQPERGGERSTSPPLPNPWVASRAPSAAPPPVAPTAIAWHRAAARTPNGHRRGVLVGWWGGGRRREAGGTRMASRAARQARVGGGRARHSHGGGRGALLTIPSSRAPPPRRPPLPARTQSQTADRARSPTASPRSWWHRGRRSSQTVRYCGHRRGSSTSASSASFFFGADGLPRGHLSSLHP